MGQLRFCYDLKNMINNLLYLRAKEKIMKNTKCLNIKAIPCLLHKYYYCGAGVGGWWW